jgi:hypothetical protein
VPSLLLRDERKVRGRDIRVVRSSEVFLVRIWGLGARQGRFICKIWYSICRTMSDYDVLCGNLNDRSVRAIAVKPRAFGGGYAALGLDRSVRPSKRGDRVANADLRARAVLLAGRTSSDSSSADFLSSPQLGLAGSRIGLDFSDHIAEAGDVVFRHACQLGFEGIVSKRLGSPYISGRSRTWLKFKNPMAPAVKREAEEDWGRGRWQ